MYVDTVRVIVLSYLTKLDVDEWAVAVAHAPRHGPAALAAGGPAWAAWLTMAEARLRERERAAAQAAFAKLEDVWVPRVQACVDAWLNGLGAAVLRAVSTQVCKVRHSAREWKLPQLLLPPLPLPDATTTNRLVEYLALFDGSKASRWDNKNSTALVASFPWPLSCGRERLRLEDGAWLEALLPGARERLRSVGAEMQVVVADAFVEGTGTAVSFRFNVVVQTGA